MTPFLEKGVFLTWLKKWVLLTVFLKSCALLKTLVLIVFSAKAQLFRQQKIYVEQNRKFMKNSGLFLNMEKWCFLGLSFFQVFSVIVVCFLCVCHSCKSVKNACFFSQFLGLLWGGLFLFIWVWKV